MKRSSISHGDIAVCAAKALVPGSTFQVSYRFAPREYAAGIVALKAFFAHVGSIPAEVSEPELGLVKLAWWQRELEPAAAGSSQHPVVRALWDSGLLSAIDGDVLAGYISAVRAFVQTETYASEDDLFGLARGIGGGEALLEAGRGVGHSQPGAVTLIGAGNFLYRAVTVPGIRKCQQASWVPLSLQARHGSSSASLAPGESDNARNDLLAALYQTARAWLSDGLEALGGSVPGKLQHLAINADLKLRRLEKLEQGSGGETAMSHSISAVREVLVAWRTARRLRRRSGQ